MLRFYSANVRIANSQRAIDECFDIAFGGQTPDDLRAIIFNTPLGHRLDRLADMVRQKEGTQNSVTLGSSCSGVTGRDGVGESMSDLAMMAICGPQCEFAYAGIDEIFGHNSYEKGLELARTLYGKTPDAAIIYLLCSGIDIANDLVIKAFEEIFGKEITIFGGTSSDNMRGLISQQYIGDALTEHGAWAMALGDTSLKAITCATHGFTAYGEPMVVTKADGNKIIELDGHPAWEVYTGRLGLNPAPDTICGETIPVGALAEELPGAVAREYGNPHILRVITKYDPDGTIHYPTTVELDTKLWLTKRDESLIFSEQKRSLEFLKERVGDGAPVAVFQTDCLARGRFLFNKVIKDEIIAMMHQALSNGDVVPAWLGMYGFGEYAVLGGRNTYHNYSTALLVLYR